MFAEKQTHSQSSVAQLTKQVYDLPGIRPDKMTIGGWIRRLCLLISRQLVVYYRDIPMLIMGPISNCISIL